MLNLQIALPLDAIADFCQRHHVKKMARCGSVLRDDFHDDSDIDVLVEFEANTKSKISLFTLGEMQVEFSAIVGHEVDLKTRGFISDRVYTYLADTLVTIYEQN